VQSHCPATNAARQFPYIRKGRRDKDSWLNSQESSNSPSRPPSQIGTNTNTWTQEKLTKRNSNQRWVISQHKPASEIDPSNFRSSGSPCNVTRLCKQAELVPPSTSEGSTLTHTQLLSSSRPKLLRIYILHDRHRRFRLPRCMSTLRAWRYYIQLPSRGIVLHGHARLANETLLASHFGYPPGKVYTGVYTFRALGQLFGFSASQPPVRRPRGYSRSDHCEDATTLHSR